MFQSSYFHNVVHFILQVSKLAEASKGFSGAEIVSLCRESMLFAIEENDDFHKDGLRIEMRHILRSIDETKKQITPDMLRFYDSFGKSSIKVQQ